MASHREAPTAPHLRRVAVATITSLSVMVLALSVPSVAQAAAPSAASLVGPADGSAVSGSSADLAVTVSDPDGDDLEVSFQGRVQGATTAGPGAGDPFTIVAIPDIQNYTYAGRPATIRTQTDWVVRTRAELSTAFVVELGDLVSAYESTKQWGNASNGLAPLDAAGIPNSVVPGNHDFDNATGEAPLYDTYFPPSRYSSASWTPSTARYGGYLGQNQFGIDPVDRRNMDSYSLFTAGGQDFLVLNLEWEAPQYALDWADRVLSAYPDRIAIMVTHSFINVSGGRRTSAQRPGGTPQSALWSSFVATHCQIRLVLSGHESNATDGEASRTDPNSCGEPVQQVLTDYQSRPNGGDGWLRYYTVDPTAGTMRATTYSPLLDRYETDADSSFTVPFDLGASEPAPFTTVATTTVPSGSTASATWGQLAADTTYEWRAVVSDGTSQTVSPSWTFRTTQPSSALLGDTFSRTEASGWGAATTGPRWNTSSSGFSVDGSRGLVTVPKGSGRTARAAGVTVQDARIRAQVTSTSTPGGSGTYVSLLGRETGAQSYRLKVVFTSGGTSTLHLVRSASGVDTTLRSVVVPGTFRAGAPMELALELAGSFPTTLRASAWSSGTAEPTGWMLSTTDATEALQGSGGVGVDTYVSSGATGSQTLALDDVAVTRLGTSPPPANVAPVAVIAEPVVDGLSVAFASTGSKDPDGSLQAWHWTFGDGAGQDGPSATHAYAVGGSYQVHLTVTDDDGASTTAATTVTVSPPPTPQDAVARDTFGRTATGSWGAADVGGSWTLSGSAGRYSLADGAAIQRVSVAGTSADSYLTGAVATAAQLRVSLSWDRTAAAGSIYTSIVPRTINGSTDYRLKIYIAASGQPALQLVRRVGGAESILATTKLPMTTAAGDWYSVAVQAAPEGGGTRLNARFWPRGAAEPTGWQVTAADATAALQGSGYPKLSSYLSGSANAPITTSYDDLLVTRP